MHVIVTANQKGGAGKTTICRNLAVAAGDGVALIDRDPQGSLTSWWNRREASEPALITVRGPLSHTLGQLRSAGVGITFIDTAPSVSPGLAEAVEAATMVLIPVRPTPDDLDAVAPVLELVEKYHKPFIFILTQAKQRTKLMAEALPVLAQHGRVSPAVIFDRVDYPTAAISGHGVTEMDPDGAAAQEVTQLLQYVMTQLDKEARK